MRSRKKQTSTETNSKPYSNPNGSKEFNSEEMGTKKTQVVVQVPGVTLGKSQTLHQKINDKYLRLDEINKRMNDIKSQLAPKNSKMRTARNNQLKLKTFQKMALKAELEDLKTEKFELTDQLSKNNKSFKSRLRGAVHSKRKERIRMKAESMEYIRKNPHVLQRKLNSILNKYVVDSKQLLDLSAKLEAGDAEELKPLMDFIQKSDEAGFITTAINRHKQIRKTLKTFLVNCLNIYLKSNKSKSYDFASNGLKLTFKSINKS
ncbi:MAG: hypothetical protein KF816_17295 [Melioribacteraceae bacterium]|nr:hypothetical protein [Melioribacteraceae bacterium]